MQGDSQNDEYRLNMMLGKTWVISIFYRWTQIINSYFYGDQNLQKIKNTLHTLQHSFSSVKFSCRYTFSPPSFKAAFLRQIFIEILSFLFSADDFVERRQARLIGIERNQLTKWKKIFFLIQFAFVALHIQLCCYTKNKEAVLVYCSFTQLPIFTPFLKVL